MEAKCPHCGKTIELLEAGDLERRYDLNGNKVGHRVEKGEFPDPWIAVINRRFWLKEDIDAYLDEIIAEERKRLDELEAARKGKL